MEQKTIFRAMIGWQAGVLVGMIGATIAFWTFDIALWMKILSTIGLLSASLGTIYGLLQTISQYKTFMQMTEVNKEELKDAEIIKDKEVENAI